MSSPTPRVPDVGALDEMVEQDVPDPAEELDRSPYDTDFGLAMARTPDASPAVR